VPYQLADYRMSKVLLGLLFFAVSGLRPVPLAGDRVGVSGPVGYSAGARARTGRGP
jgi:hypothetical protein